MSSRQLVLWRHGRTSYNVSARLQGQVDVPLDAVGRWQAATAGAALARRGPVHTVITSDLDRAMATAHVLADIVNSELVVDPRLRERSFGEWEGLTGQEIADRWPEDFERWRCGQDPLVGGMETREAVARRVVPAIDEHLHAPDQDGKLVVVSHGAAITIAVSAILGQPASWRGIAGLRNAHWTELTAAHGGPDGSGLSAPGGTAWRLTGHNLGPTDASRDWDAGPDEDEDGNADAAVRDPD